MESRHKFVRVMTLLSVWLLGVLLVGCTSDSTGEGNPAEREPSTASTAGDAEPDARVPELAGAWIVIALVSADGQSALLESARAFPTLIFEDGDLMGDTGGCNSIFGRYQQAGDRGQDLVFPTLGSSQVGCSEAPLVARLAEVRHVSIHDGSISLLEEDETLIAELRRRGQRQHP